MAKISILERVKPTIKEYIINLAKIEQKWYEKIYK